MYLYIDGQLIPIRMRKRDILNALAKDDAQKKEIIKYYKDNKLSYKSKEDLKKVLTR